MDHELPRHAVRTFLYAENAEDMESFEPSAYPRACAFVDPKGPEVSKLAGP